MSSQSTADCLAATVGASPGQPATVAVVLVLFQPDPDALSASIRAWSDQAAYVVCVDNGGAEPILGTIGSLAAGRVRLVQMRGNAGLGAAHNRGIALARSLECSHVVLGDQDSLPTPGMVSELLRVEAQALATKRPIAVVGPRLIDAPTGHAAKFVRFGTFNLRRLDCPRPDGWLEVDLLFSSGSLIRMQAIDRIGAMDETLFIDMVDNDWCLRARHAGWVAIGACGATMHHHLGDETIVVRLGRTRTLPVHKPFRYYYMFRNSLLLYRRDYAERRWILLDLARLVQIGLFFGLVHRARRANLQMMVRGIVDGLRGVSGRMPDR